MFISAGPNGVRFGDLADGFERDSRFIPGIVSKAHLNVGS